MAANSASRCAARSLAEPAMTKEYVNTHLTIVGWLMTNFLSGSSSLPGRMPHGQGRLQGPGSLSIHRFQYELQSLRLKSIDDNVRPVVRRSTGRCVLVAFTMDDCAASSAGISASPCARSARFAATTGALEGVKGHILAAMRWGCSRKAC